MRVHLITGPSGAGKTARLRECAGRMSGDVWWLVPNEFHLAEALNFPDHVKTLTLPQAALFLTTLPAEQKLISERHQRLLLQFAVDGLLARSKLKSLAPLAATRGFAGTLFSFVSELRGAGIAPEQFDACSRQLGLHATRRRLDSELALVARTYHELLAKQQFLDRAGVYGAAASGRQPLSGVFLDGFTSFTPLQLPLLRALAESADEMWISLSIDEDRIAFDAAPHDALLHIRETFPELHEVRAEAPLDRRHKGLVHLSQQLFMETSAPSAESSGLSLIEAPGAVGECRMVVRAVKRLLQSGVAPADILVSCNNLLAYADLLAETFDEYDVPIAFENQRSMMQCPAIVALLQAALLPDGGWPFVGVAKLLRSGWFRPSWPELSDDPTIPLTADLLLRDLGEPRGREAYLAAIHEWAVSPRPPLEDEEAEGSVRARRQELATLCRPFLVRFFAAWDAAPRRAAFSEHCEWLRTWAADVGFPEDEPALSQWWTELDEYAALDRQIAPRRLWQRAGFLSQLDELAALAAIAEDADNAPAVRIVPADLAAGLTYEHLFLLGLGEGGFPALASSPGFYSDAERQEFRAAGLEFDVVADRLPKQKLLFHRLVTRAGQSVTFSYPALDEKGLEKLPCSFLREVRKLFPNLPVVRRQMLTDGLTTDPPLCDAERRVRFAAEKNGDASALEQDQVDHLSTVRRMAQSRFRDAEFSPFDGMLSDRDVKADVATSYGPAKLYSATSLEDYIACPFRYFAKHVLKLSALGEPSEEIEAHRRGAAFHRALARMKSDLDGAEDPGARLADELADAIREYVERAASPTTHLLWQLELERLQRAARRYTEQRNDYLAHWNPAGTPQFHQAEWGYDIRIVHENFEVRLAGRIDRVDILVQPDGPGVIVVDYKTGRASSYTSGPVANLEKLQLAVYALAAEHLLEGARPIGLLYWLPTDAGPKVALPKKSLDWADGAGWLAYRGRLQQWLTNIVERIRSGAFPLQPRSENACLHCDYHRMCRIAQSRRIQKDWAFELPMVGGEDHE